MINEGAATLLGHTMSSLTYVVIMALLHKSLQPDGGSRTPTEDDTASFLRTLVLNQNTNSSSAALIVLIVRN